MTDAPEPLHQRTFSNRSLKGSRFVECDFGDVVVRGSELAGLELDSPWLFEHGATLLVNGVDVVPLVDAALNSRWPGRELRTASDPAGLRAAWAAIEETWDATVRRAEALPPGVLDASVDGEWSFTQTLRHLVLATDVWLGKAILGLDRPFHPLGLAPGDGETEAWQASDFSDEQPSWQQVLDARADRRAMVRDYIAGVTASELGEQRRNPHAPQHPETVLSCLQVILGEEWEHHRYAVRDLDALPRGDGSA